MATGEGFGMCSLCGRPDAWHSADTCTRITEEHCECGFSEVRGPDEAKWRYKEWAIQHDGNVTLHWRGQVIATSEQEVFDLFRLLEAVLPPDEYKQSVEDENERQEALSILGRYEAEFRRQGRL